MKLTYQIGNFYNHYLPYLERLGSFRTMNYADNNYLISNMNKAY